MANLSQSLLKGARAYQGQNVVDRNELVVKYAPLVKRVAMHLKARLPASVDVNDLVQSGMIGLIESLQNYKEGQGATFETYASIRIRGAIIDQLRQSDWTPRSVHQNTRAIREAMLRLSHEKGRPATDAEIAAYLKVDINRYHQMLLDSNTSQVMGIEDTGLTDDVIGDQPLSEIVGQMPDDKLFESINGAQFKKALAHAISQLPQREREILTFYYDQEMNLREIGLIKGISESRTCQILSQAVVRLRASLEDWANPPQTQKHAPLPKESIIAPGSLPQPTTKKRSSLLFNENDEIVMRTPQGRAALDEREREQKEAQQAEAELRNASKLSVGRKKRSTKSEATASQSNGMTASSKQDQELFLFIHNSKSYLAQLRKSYTRTSIKNLVKAEPSVAQAKQLIQLNLLLQESLSKLRQLTENVELRCDDALMAEDADALPSTSRKGLQELSDALQQVTADYLEYLHQVNTAFKALESDLVDQAYAQLQEQADEPEVKPKRAVRPRGTKSTPRKNVTEESKPEPSSVELTVVKVPRRRRSVAASKDASAPESDS
ncbi:MAG TPA: RNA polymerase sigma factor FliA [Candidatus Anaerobiospirillum stercoravium]|nr:RNA polymerase sigma factor FliA [Candidatus Anaerobiospirillum stercoravium]